MPGTGLYFTGDGASRDPHGHYYITGVSCVAVIFQLLSKALSDRWFGVHCTSTY